MALSVFAQARGSHPGRYLELAHGALRTTRGAAVDWPHAWTPAPNASAMPAPATSWRA